MEILVLRQKIHGMDASGYAEILRETFPEQTVREATTPAQEQESLQSADIVTGFELSPEDLEHAENLELFGCVFAGTGHLELDAFKQRDIAVTNASGVHGPNISEYVIGAMIHHAKRFGRAHRQQERREWRSYKTDDLHNSTVTIVGLGAIGTAVAERLDGFGMETVGVRYTPEKGGPTDDVYGFDKIHEAVNDAEYVVLACPLTDATAGLIDEDVFKTMHPDGVLVNIGRGPVVDTDALVSAIRWNRIGGATLDVSDPEPLPTDHPLWSMDNVMLTPHNSGYSPEYFERRSAILERNIERIRGGEHEELENQVV
ncbi:D-2-hydroxyacid dehydrogenase [Halovenus rubra]|uniref:D-2-hydroxyacid dehydrogenase n=2 Tax=Halovenus rubra TaxID=869890 RepID=A0ABD5X428_9EURY|nr:D-2-hydroxyacid dehydrogenase [Halovenus rubra]